MPNRITTTRLVLCCALSLLGACSGRIADPRGGAGNGVGEDGGLAANGGGGRGGAAGSDDPAQTGPYLASASVARRLSRAELDNTVRELLLDGSSPATRLLTEDLYAPYDNDYATQRASGALIDSLELLASDVASRALANSVTHQVLVPCTPSGNGDAACFQKVVEGFLPRAFRRPVSSDEVAAYMPLLDFATENNLDVPHDFDTAVELMLRSVLQDPEFLYRIEIGAATSNPGVFTLDDHEIASRLSYLLWGSMPDEQLRAEADSGELVDPAMRSSIATRMLKDARARNQLHRFHAMWLGYRAIPQSAALAAAFQSETSALIDRVVFDEPQSYLNIFTYEQTYLDDMLADHYALPRPSGGKGWVDYGKSGRAGLLSHGSVLSAFSKFSDTSPTQRGILIRTRLLCETLSPPPPTVMADKPPVGDKDAVCKFDRYAAHRNSASCAGCHALTDGIGFGLENYDIAGRYREHDDGLTQCKIEGKGEIVNEGSFSGPAELGALLVDKGLVEPCIVQQLFRFAIGRAPQGNELDALDELTAEFAQHDHSFAELLVSLVESEAFAKRLEPGK